MNPHAQYVATNNVCVNCRSVFCVTARGCAAGHASHGPGAVAFLSAGCDATDGCQAGQNEIHVERGDRGSQTHRPPILPIHESPPFIYF
jgi:hypothetical protein